MGDRVRDKVAIVTGAGSRGPGIGNGKATAILLAREGARVFAVDLNLKAAQDTKRMIHEEGGECVVHEADVSKSTDCSMMVEKCIKAFGRIDILHNNVGISGRGGPVEISEDFWDKVMNVNLKSMFLTCKYVLPYMESQSSGAIVNVSSINAIRIQPFPAVAYAASKAGVIALTREIALQYAVKNIRANAILPGLMNTPMVIASTKSLYGGDKEEMIRKRDAMCPTGKQGTAWDTAHAALFLASDAAKYITGTTLIIDGGISATMRS